MKALRFSAALLLSAGLAVGCGAAADFPLYPQSRAPFELGPEGGNDLKMKTRTSLRLSAMLALALGSARADGVVCAAACCPERENDFVWENDKFGMRAYGPGEFHKWSGFDVFNKGRNAGSAVEMMHHPSDCGDWHRVPWKGVVDNYTMGASRGVGGVAMYADGEWKTYPDWESSRVIHTGDDYLEFELVYPAFSAAGKMTCHITLRKGERFFRNDVSFERMRKDFLVGPGIDLDPQRGHKGSVCETSSAVSVFEDAKPAKEGGGSTMSAIFVAPDAEVTPMTDHLNCRVLAFRGQRTFTYWAGASWSEAGEVTTALDWHDLVRRFQTGVAPAAHVVPDDDLQKQCQAVCDWAVREGLQGALQFCAYRDGKSWTSGPGRK